MQLYHPYQELGIHQLAFSDTVQQFAIHLLLLYQEEGTSNHVRNKNAVLATLFAHHLKKKLFWVGTLR